MTEILIQLTPLALIVLIFAIAIRYSYKIKQKNLQEGGEIKGIGGWLIVFIIALFSSLGRMLSQFAQKNNTYVNTLSSYEKNIDTFESIGVTFGIILLVIVIINFFQKKRRIINLLTFYYFYLISYSIIDAVLISSYYNLDDTSILIIPIVGNMIPAAIWISYFQRSVRVKNTFIN